MRRFDDEDLTGAEFRECDLSRAHLRAWHQPPAGRADQAGEPVWT